MADIADFDLDFEGAINLSSDSPSGAMANFHTGEHLKHEASCSCVPCTVEARKVHTGLADCLCKICSPPDWNKDTLLQIKNNERNSYKFAILPQVSQATSSQVRNGTIMLACPMGHAYTAGEKGQNEADIRVSHEEALLAKEEEGEAKGNEFYDKEVPNAAKAKSHKPHIYDCKCEICMPWTHAYEYIEHRFGQLFEETYANKEEEMLKTYRQDNMESFEGGGAHDDNDDRYDVVCPNTVYPDAENLPPNTNEELDPDFKMKPTDPSQLESAEN